MFGLKLLSETAGRLERDRSARALPVCDYYSRALHARTLLPEQVASVSLGFVLVRARVAEWRQAQKTTFLSPPPEGGLDLVTNRQGAI